VKRAQIEVWRVTAGSFVRYYATDYHADQMARALFLNGMEPVVERVTLPRDPLTALTTNGAL
jgi:hypothetical protein